MRQDRRDPYPWTWEPALAGLLACGLLLMLSVQLGRGIACVAVGAGFCWPSRESLVPSVWPETFSFTTHETLATGLPVLALDLGAQGAAVRSAPNGIAVPHVPGGDHAAAILAALGFGPA